MDNQVIGSFALEQILSKNKTKFWNEILEIHDTYGVPFDLIYVKLKDAGKFSFEWTSEAFSLFMKDWREMQKPMKAVE